MSARILASRNKREGWYAGRMSGKHARTRKAGAALRSYNDYWKAKVVMIWLDEAKSMTKLPLAQRENITYWRKEP